MKPLNSAPRFLAEETSPLIKPVNFRKSNPFRNQEARGDAAKFLSYTEAWARIREARKSGFFLEAVTIEESIISDRLTSFLVKTCGYDPNSKSLRTLNGLSNTWLQFSKSHLPALTRSGTEVDELNLRLNTWRESRNAVVHGLVKSRVARNADHIDNFLNLAAFTAHEGNLLAREITRWVEVARRETKVKCVMPLIKSPTKKVE